MKYESSILTIKATHKRHKDENPDSPLGERAIRAAVKDGSLPSLKVGTTRYINYDVFNEWLRGDMK